MANLPLGLFTFLHASFSIWYTCLNKFIIKNILFVKNYIVIKAFKISVSNCTVYLMSKVESTLLFDDTDAVAITKTVINDKEVWVNSNPSTQSYSYL